MDPLAIFISQARYALTNCVAQKIVQRLISVQIPISRAISYRLRIVQKSTFALFFKQLTQAVFTFSNSAMEIPEQCLKSVRS